MNPDQIFQNTRVQHQQANSVSYESRIKHEALPESQALLERMLLSGEVHGLGNHDEATTHYTYWPLDNQSVLVKIYRTGPISEAMSQRVGQISDVTAWLTQLSEAGLKPELVRPQDFEITEPRLSEKH